MHSTGSDEETGMKGEGKDFGNLDTVDGHKHPGHMHMDEKNLGTSTAIQG